MHVAAVGRIEDLGEGDRLWPEAACNVLIKLGPWKVRRVSFGSEVDIRPSAGVEDAQVQIKIAGLVSPPLSA